MVKAETDCRNVVGGKSSWPIFTVLAALAVWLLQLSAVTRPFDGWVYDQLFQANLSFSKLDSHVLLVYVGRDTVSANSADAGDVPLDRIIGNLLDAGATCVGTTFQPPTLSQNLARLARPGGRVILGRELILDPSDMTQTGPAPMPFADTLQTGLVGTARGHHGVYRGHVRALTMGEQRLPLLESAMAEHHAGNSENNQPNAFGVNYRGGPGSLPVIDSQRILDGQLVRELVVGKVVLIGYHPDSSSTGISTPTTRFASRMSLLEFHGHALNTLIARRELKTAGPVVCLAAILLSAFLSLLAFRNCTLQRASLTMLGMLGVTCASVLALLSAYQIWLPCVPLVLVQVLIFGYIFADKYRFSNTTLNNMLFDLSVMIRRRRWPTDFSATEEPWEQLLVLMRQIFHLERLIILELPSSEVYLREVSALNCSFADINERRRDHRRWPYSAAYENQAPLQIGSVDHPLFKNAVADEQQYLVPLIFGGELFGFLALGITPEHLTTFPDFEGRLKDFADELAELLYRRQWALADQSNQRHPLTSLSKLMRVPEANAYSELVHATHLLERRLERLENMFETADTASAIFDIFGRLLMVNERMVQTLASHEAVPAEMTTVDLVATLTGWKLEACRRLLRRVILEKQQESLPVVVEDSHSVFILCIRPLELELPQARVAPDDPHPLQVQGVHCELIDRTSIVDMIGSSIRDQEATVARRDPLTTIEYAESLLQEGSAVGHTAGAAVRDGSGSSVAASRSPFDSSTATESHHGLVDVTHVVHAALERHTQYASLHDIELRLRGLDDVSLVDLEGACLDRVLSAALELVFSDARDDSVVRVTLAGDASETTITVANDGFGFEVDRIRRILDDAEETSIEELRRLREAVQTAKEWGGDVEVATELGEGTTVRILLPQRVEP